MVVIDLKYCTTIRLDDEDCTTLELRFKKRSLEGDKGGRAAQIESEPGGCGVSGQFLVSAEEQGEDGASLGGGAAEEPPPMALGTITCVRVKHRSIICIACESKS
jgi:hypothetical protein